MKERMILIKKSYDGLFVARGIGILLVVLGHIIPQESYLGGTIYSFHMPLFILLSGVFASTCEKYKFIDYLKKSVSRLIVPYVVFTLIGIALNYIIVDWRIYFSAATFKDVLINCNAYYWQTTGALWFLVALFIIRILFYFYDKLILKKGSAMLIALSLVCLFYIAIYLNVFQVWMSQYHPAFTFPFQLKSAMIGLPFYIIGYLLKDNIKSFSYKDNPVLNSVLFVGSAVLTFGFAVRYNHTVNLGANTYNDSFLFVVFAFTGIYITIVIGSLLKKSKVLIWFGKHSMEIYLLHNIFHHIYNWICKKYFGQEIDRGFSAQNIVRFIVMLSLSSLGAWLITRAKTAIKEKKAQKKLDA